VPLTLTLCVVFVTPPELSVIVIVPLRDPDAFGVNVIETEQLEFTATDWPEQPSELIANSGESFDTTLLTDSAALPELVTVKYWYVVDVVFTGWEAKVMLVGKTVACGIGFVPVPFSVMT
jgi:hypothetical protein